MSIYRGKVACMLLSALILLLVCAGCEMESEIESRLNALDRPVKVVSVSDEGDVLVSSATGKLVMIPEDYYMARALRNLKPGDVVAQQAN